MLDTTCTWPSATSTKNSVHAHARRYSLLIARSHAGYLSAALFLQSGPMHQQ